MFRQQVGNLQLIVGIYNNVQATILPVEKPLITQKLDAVDSALKKGLQVTVSRQLIETYTVLVLSAALPCPLSTLHTAAVYVF